MPIFKYKGVDKSGKEVKGSVNSENLNVAKQKIKSQQILLLSIKEESSKEEKGSSKGLSLFKKGVNINELSLFTRQLSTLLKAKIQIVEAISALVEQTDNEELRIVLADVKQKVNEGSSLAKAMGDHSKIFNNIYVNMVEAGESSGTLEIVLNRLADFTERQVKLKNKISGALTYPVIMAVVAMLMIGIIFIFVIPKITKIFQSTKKKLPLQTEIAIWLSNFLQNYWWAIIMGAFLTVWGFKKYKQTPQGKRQIDSLLLKMPVIKDLVVKINLSLFTSTLGTLLGSGVPILFSLKIVKNLITNVYIQEAVEQARVSISEGGSMATPLIKSEIFPPMVTHMIGIGEKSGELESMLAIIAENYEDQVNNQLSGLTSILEPIMMIGMGLVVGFIVFSVVVPMVEMNSVK